MINILILDSNTRFLNDVEGRFLLDAPDDIDFVLSSDFDDIEGQIEEDDIDFVVFNMADYDNFIDFSFADHIKTYSYAKNSEQLMHSQRLNIPSYGIITKPKVLINKIANNDFIQFEENDEVLDEDVVELDSNIGNDTNYEEDFPDNDFIEEENDMPSNDNSLIKNNNLFDESDENEDLFDEDDIFDLPDELPPRGSRTVKPRENNTVSNNSSIHNKPVQRKSDNSKRTISRQTGSISRTPERNKNTRLNRNNIPETPVPDIPDAVNEPKTRVRRSTIGDNKAKLGKTSPIITTEEESVVGKSKSMRRNINKEETNNEVPDISKENKRKKRSLRTDNKKQETSSQLTKKLNKEIDKELNIAKDPAKIITIYSAKGGVGKTTIACELATALALTSHGRGKLNVCLVDYNIDFGDVLTTLGFDSRKTCMSYWASDIRELLAGNPDNEIQYTQEEIRKHFLQKNPNTGLYALLAPLTNEDSMDISEAELRIMLENLRDYGGFDYIICDTGNNTRDSSYIALEMADEVLMIYTQSINTFNCNDSFLTVMNKIHFNMDKFAIIINKIRPEKLVNLSANEIEQSAVNPRSGKPYPCYAKIKDTSDVMKANNDAVPLVYNSNHEFTQQIRTVIAKIAGDQFVLEEPKKKKKKGLFSFFSKK